MRGVIVGGGVIGLSVAWEMVGAGFSCTVIDQGPIGRGCSWAGAGILPPARLDTALDPIDRLRGLSHQMYPAWTSTLERVSGIDPEFSRCGGIYLSRSIGETAALTGQADYWSEYGLESERLTAERLRQVEPGLNPSTLENSNLIHGARPTRQSQQIAQQLASSQPSSDQASALVQSRATAPSSESNGSPSKGPEKAPHEPHYLDAWFVPDECQVRPPRLLRALRRACELQGVVMLENTPVTRLIPESPSPSSRVIAVESAAGRHEADVVVLCCGAWAGQFNDPIGQLPNVFPVRGQVVQYRLAPGKLQRVVNEGNRYLMPRKDGVLYVGSSEEEVGLTEGTTPEIISSLITWAQSLVPELRDIQPERTWSGLRPGSMDGFPFIGRSPGWKNLYVATGHFRSGLHLACGTAKVLVETIQNVPTSVPIDAFAVAR